MRKSFYFLILLGMFSCNRVNSYSVYYDDKIDRVNLIQIDGLDKQVLNYIEDNNQKGIETLASEQLMKAGLTGLSNIRDIISNIDNLELIPYKNCLITGLKPDLGTIQFPSDKSNELLIKISPITSTQFISIKKVKVNKTENFIVCFIWGKVNKDWKLHGLYMGGFDVLNRNAREWYLIAKNELEHENYINAFLFCEIATYYQSPAPFIEFNEFTDFEEFQRLVLEKLNKAYKLPITLNEIKSEPQIFGINQTIVEEGYIVPIISYKTSYDKIESSIVEQEAKLIAENLRTNFKGLDKFDRFVIRAHNDIPNQSNINTIRYYGYPFNFKE